MTPKTPTSPAPPTIVEPIETTPTATPPTNGHNDDNQYAAIAKRAKVMVYLLFYYFVIVFSPSHPLRLLLRKWYLCRQEMSRPLTRVEPHLLQCPQFLFLGTDNHFLVLKATARHHQVYQVILSYTKLY